MGSTRGEAKPSDVPNANFRAVLTRRHLSPAALDTRCLSPSLSSRPAEMNSSRRRIAVFWLEHRGSHRLLVYEPAAARPEPARRAWLGAAPRRVTRIDGRRRRPRRGAAALRLCGSLSPRAANGSADRGGRPAAVPGPGGRCARVSDFCRPAFEQYWETCWVCDSHSIHESKILGNLL